ncbi:MAG: ATP-binding protein [Chloroflexota bacterium]
MTIWRQLRWRIIAAYMLVVIVGVVTLAWMANIVSEHTVATAVNELSASVEGMGMQATDEQLSTILLTSVRATVTQSLVVAGLAATLVGGIASVLLVREILLPLRQITQSSQRIAAGHYDERVAVPTSDELATLATNFNQMAIALEQVEQQRIALIGNVAHELRTPLTGVEGYLEGLVDGIFSNDPETLNAMQHEVRRLRRLVDDLQTLSRVESGQIELQLTYFNLIPLLQRVVEQLRPQITAQNLTLDLTDRPDSLQVYADVDRTAQVLINLIGNAIQYTPEGGSITVRVQGGDRKVQISVQDTGIGIPAESLPYLFERFYRVDRSRSRSSGGSGIGLTITRHLVWAMGGDLDVASDGPDQGSTFRFTLPLSG